MKKQQPDKQQQQNPPKAAAEKKNVANKNKYSRDADSVFTLAFTSFGVARTVRVQQRSAEESWPGGALWDTGVVVAKLFLCPTLTPVTPATRWRDLNVLELGCGTGLTGIVLGALGARRTVVTDMEVVVDQVARYNVELNAPLYTAKGHEPRVVAMSLPWGADHLDTARAALQKIGGQPDILLAVDIAYNRPGFPPHFDLFIETALFASNKETVFVYGHRARMDASQDLLHGIYDHFEDIRPPIPADAIDPKVFGNGYRHNISVHILRRRSMDSGALYHERAPFPPPPYQKAAVTPVAAVIPTGGGGAHRAKRKTKTRPPGPAS